MNDSESSNPEKMADFFNKRATTYDEHMQENVDSFQQIYKAISTCISETSSKIQILDIGCGTGLELTWILKKAPNAIITAVDISAEMLNILLYRFKNYPNQIKPIQESYLKLYFDNYNYDYVIAVMTLHHLLPDTKRILYKRILNSLKPQGIYIEGDYIVSRDKEIEFLSEYKMISEGNKAIKDGSHHIDIPMSLETEKELMIDAGFTKIDVVLEKSEASVISAKS
jgi:tRNA (cmo5U34)-methyltransferase